ncbi:MAG: hypothetical protein ACM3H8_00010 [Sphingobacteriales bacterium]
MESNDKDNLQEVVLSDIENFTKHEKTLKNARVWLYIIAGLQFVMGVYELLTIDGTIGIFAFLIDAAIAFVFLILSFWSKKNPSTAFLTALIFYLVLYILLGISDQGNFIKGILVKIFVVIALAKAYNNAKEISDLKKEIEAK